MSTNYNELALKIRQHVVRMTHDAKSSHVGSCLSCADILAVLYGGVLQKEDKFIMSKGHASAALYATLAECGYFPLSDLEGFYNGKLSGHVSHFIKGVEASTGSLGHGLSIGCGMALTTKNKVYVLLSDGDLNEGSTWEAVMFASQHKLSNLTVIVDYNGFQCTGRTQDIINLKPLSEKWRAFGWFVLNIDGHSYRDLENAFEKFEIDSPICIITNTIKGKGVIILENTVESHHRYLNNEELKQALGELR
jgi:transketolase